jgi:prepilin-type N-terminal cleavage/methylation domain-containing protein
MLRIHARAHRRSRQDGFTLIEVTISAVVVAIVMMASVAAFSGNLRAVDESRKLSDAATFLRTTMENVSAQPYVNLLALDGTDVFENTDEGDSNFRIGLTAFLAEVDLVQVEARVIDNATGHVLGTTALLRSSR